MKKNYYFAVDVNENGKNYSYVVKATESDNLLNVFGRIKNINWVNIFPTKKEAERVVEYWNNSFKQNGTYLFDKPSF